MADAPRLILEVRGGAYNQKRVLLDPGTTLKVGRTELADVIIANDENMSQLHYEISWDGAVCRVRDLGSDLGTFIGGQPLPEGELSNGGWVRAGRTDFMVFVEDMTPSDEQLLVLRARSTKILDLVKGLADKRVLYAVVDAARNERAQRLLETGADEYLSLFEGTTAITLADAAPYLVKFDPGSALLHRLLAQGWGDAWFSFCACEASMKDLRAHFRKLLYVTRERDEQQMFFRFYDPRALRAFLRVATVRQGELMFGPVDAYLVEDVDPRHLLRFYRGASSVACDRVEILV